MVEKHRACYYTADYQKEARSYFKEIIAKLKSNDILLDPHSENPIFRSQDGVEKLTVINPYIWRQVYADLHRDSRQRADMPNIENVIENANKEFLEKKRVIVGIMDFDFYRVSDISIKKFLMNMRNKEILKHPENENQILEKRHIFAASPLINTLPGETEIEFYFDSSSIYTNIENENLEGFLVNFDDGNGAKHVKPGDSVKVKYNHPGSKTITVTALISGKALTCESVFSIEESKHTDNIDINIVNYDDSWYIRAEEPYMNEYGKGSVYIWYGAGHGREIKKPIVLISGFSPLVLTFNKPEKLDSQKLYDMFNKSSLLDTAKSKGHDILALSLDNPTDYIQRCAFVVAALLNKINGIKTSTAKINIIGASMGGLVIRYALTCMEYLGGNHFVKNYLSLDSPIEGANIPLGIQYFLRYFQDKAQACKDPFVYQIETPAAKQMLLSHHWDSQGRPNPLRLQLLKELNEMAGKVTKGFPQLCENTIAIVSGSRGKKQETIGEDKKKKEIGENTPAFYWDWKEAVWGWVNSMPTLTGAKVFRGYYCGAAICDSYVASEILPFDTVPGAFATTYKTIEEGINGTGYGGKECFKLFFDKHCFIPSQSACGIALMHDNMFSKVDTSKSPFKEVWIGDENMAHCDMTEDMVNKIKFLLEKD